MTAAEYFKVAETAAHDPRRIWSVIAIIDVLGAETDFELQDIHVVLEFN